MDLQEKYDNTKAKLPNWAKKPVDCAEDAAISVKYRCSNMKDKVVQTSQLVDRQYRTLDVWNFGDYMLARMIALADFLQEQSYAEGSYEWFMVLSECANAFRSYKSVQTLTDNMPLNSNNTIDSYKEKYDKYQKDMLDAWERFAVSVLFNKMRPTPVFYGVHSNSLSNAFAHAKSSFIPEDVDRYLGAREAHLYACMLKDLVKNIHGYPDSYLQNFGRLAPVEDGWEDRTPSPTVFAVYNDYNARFVSIEDGVKRLKTRREEGLDYCSWVEDIEYAAYIFECYASWNLPDNIRYDADTPTGRLSVCEQMEYIDPYQALEIDCEMNAEVMRVWMWVGKNLADLWD